MTDEGTMFNQNLKSIHSALAAFTGSTLLFAGFQGPACAASADDLLRLLKNKDVITQEEYDILADKRGEEKKDEIKPKFKDGITFESGDGQNSFSVNGRAQLDYRTFSDPNVMDGDTFDVRRAYLGAKGKFWNDYTFEVTADFATTTGPTSTVCTNAGCTSTAAVATQNSTSLDVAWFNVNWWEAAQFRFGQFKMPMSLEEQTSSRFIDFQERSFVNNSSLTSGKERGAMLHGTPLPGVFYGLAYTTGQGKNTNETSNRFDENGVVGRVGANFAEMFGIKDTVLHLGTSFADDDLPAAAASSQRTEGRGVTFFSPAAFTTAANQDMTRERYQFEGAATYGPLKLQGEYANVNFDGRSALGVNYDKDIDAFYLAALWLITGEKYSDAYKDGRFDRIKPKANFVRPGKGGPGAWELGVRYSEFDASDFNIVSAAGALAGSGIVVNSATSATTNEADAYTLQLKWIVNPNTRFMVDWVHTDFETPLTITNSGKTVTNINDEDAYTFRAQYDF
jgi:phosphate-selective porin OprO/OprP